LRNLADSVCCERESKRKGLWRRRSMTGAVRAWERKNDRGRSGTCTRKRAGGGSEQGLHAGHET